VVAMTVYKIEESQMEVTPFGSSGAAFAGVGLRAFAHSASHDHSWVLAPGERCWPGDVVSVTVYKDDFVPLVSTEMQPPPLDLTTR